MKKENEYQDLLTGYLQSRLSAAETEHFYAWVNESTSNKELFFQFKALYDATTVMQNEPNVVESWKRLLSKRKNAASRTYNVGYKLSSYAAVALVAIALTTLFFLRFTGNEHDLSACYTGGNGLEADVVELPDGTRVSLGSKTTFRYDKDYGKHRRIVYLEGEAYFDVAKEKDKPFIVRTKEQDIEALGTRFNVMAYPTDSLVITTLEEGSVRLTTAGLAGQLQLHPDQQSVYNRNTGTAFCRKVDARQFTSWTTGYYYFSGQSLKSILDRLSHVYGVQFTIRSEALNNRTFTGTFYRGQNMKDIMEIINLSVPIHYRIDDHHIILSE